MPSGLGARLKRNQVLVTKLRDDLPRGLARRRGPDRGKDFAAGPAGEIAGPAGPHAEVIDDPESVKAGEEAVAAVRSKRDASIVQAAAAVGDGRADALVSAGSTGPTLAAAALSIKR